ncbi:DNA polymerase beta domain-containing protein [Ectothiorhodospira sp. PHS-1]|uniref:nucleotidyltransferase family protein n=1 Tax=Ectothiorhodospira sp. PHS-1 TaxID=519989 RepID=UPI00024A81A0|nr:nucleotidyltransferase domain-containing protein [Ectothiorhodospira sp. PHS-1]EHQ51478.1 DNA polymerase beta domain-containing protein [Ectothiorhodospira sp. PHS-1]
MRLTSEQADTIAENIRRHLGRNARIWLFGSRLDDSRKGGDLDLYVETDPHPLYSELRCKIELEEILDIPVDLIVREFEDNTPIGSIAKNEGLSL